MGLEHAKHNESLCKELSEKKVYFDWIVTTAFYSALHYVEHQLFPLTVGPSTFSSFDTYYSRFKVNNDNKHYARKRLVYSNISSDAGAAYNWLMDNCWTAKYYDYTTCEQDADIAIQKLEKIKAAMTKSLV